MVVMRTVTAATTGPRTGRAAGRRGSIAGHLGGEHGKSLAQFFRAAMRTGGFPFPLGGTHEEFEILFTLAADKFVEWHSGILADHGGLSSSSCMALLGGRTGAATCRSRLAVTI